MKGRRRSSTFGSRPLPSRKLVPVHREKREVVSLVRHTERCVRVGCAVGSTTVVAFLFCFFFFHFTLFLIFIFLKKNVCIMSYFIFLFVLLLTERGDFGHLQTYRDDYYTSMCCALNIFPFSFVAILSNIGAWEILIFFFYFLPSILKILFFSSCFFFFFLFYWSRLSASLPVHRRRIFRSFFYFII